MKIRNATTTDFPFIQRSIKEWLLDYENLTPEQFIVVEEDDRILGFGRLKPYPDGTVELGCVGVIPERRKQGIGEMITNELIRRGPDTIYITTDLSNYFVPFGFKLTSEYPEAIKKKLAWCETGTCRPGVVPMVLKKGNK